MVATPLPGPITRSVCVGVINGIWLTTTCDNVSWFGGISLLSLSTDANVMPLLLISLITLVGGSSFFLFWSLELLCCSIVSMTVGRMPFLILPLATVTVVVLLLIICMPFDVIVVFPTAEPFLFKFNGIAAFDALNSAGEMPSEDRLMAIGWLCAFVKPFELAVRPFGKDFFMFAVGVSTFCQNKWKIDY